MEQLKIEPTARWTVTQPWRGLFGVAVTLLVTLTITAIFDMDEYLGLFTLWVMAMVPLEIVMGLGWGGKYPPTEGPPQPWRGIALTAFMFLFGTLTCFALLNFMSAGVAQPFTNIYVIETVNVTFFAVIAFAMWPFNKMSLPAKGFLTLICVYLVMWAGLRLFNFSILSYPTGVNPSPIGAVPFYGENGPLAIFAGIAPSGPFGWESAMSFFFWMVLFLLVFTALDMWPFSQAPSLMKQPILGITLFITCGVCTGIAYIISVGVMKVEPLRFMLDGVCYLFGLLMIMIMFQMWPGRNLKPPVGGLVNVALAIGIGIIAFYGISAFCSWHFGEAFTYPNNWFSMANVMLGLTFPAWAAYAIFWDFWPLPPTPISS
jgi:hypothetical protein